MCLPKIWEKTKQKEFRNILIYNNLQQMYRHCPVLLFRGGAWSKGRSHLDHCLLIGFIGGGGFFIELISPGNIGFSVLSSCCQALRGNYLCEKIQRSKNMLQLWWAYNFIWISKLQQHRSLPPSIHMSRLPNIKHEKYFFMVIPYMKSISKFQ